MARRAAARTVTHYERLGIARQASGRDVKLSFYQRAKALHPDRSPLDTAEAQREFVMLLEAYQRRAAYDRELDVAAALNEDAGLRRWAPTAHGFGRETPPQAGPDDSEDGASGNVGSHDAFAVFVAQHGITSKAAWGAQLVREYNDALFRAYMGPLWTSTDARHFPCDFEAEPRSSPEQPDLLHLLRGRQLLGRVVAVTPSRSARIGGPAGPHGYEDPTELHYQGTCVARAYRVPAPELGPSRYTLRVYLPTSAPAPLDQDPHHHHDVDTHMECRAQVHGMDRRGRWSMLTVSDGPGHQLNYRARLYGTFFVRHLVLYNAEGHAVGRVARARLLPRALWLWEARTATHGHHGAWVFDLSDRDDRYIHPALPVMVAAYLSLDEERRRRQRGFGLSWLS